MFSKNLRMSAQDGPVGGQFTAVTCDEHRIRELASLPEATHFLRQDFSRDCLWRRMWVVPDKFLNQYFLMYL
jgi:hypothetical protein